ncbi:MAG: hypothetical protein WEB52_05430 [Dehalococcoidia bacterium]
MDDFRSQLRGLIDSMRAEGVNPVFLVIDSEGADSIKAARGAESLEQFKDAVVRAVVSATGGADAFSYGDERVVAVLGSEWGRLRTFSLIDKLRRSIPLVGQSFDCFLRPNFDVLEYDDEAGIGALIAQLTTRRTNEELSA